MAIFTGSAALLTAGKLILKQIAKEGLKKAAQSAVKKGAKKIVKKAVKKKAKDFLKKDAIILIDDYNEMQVEDATLDFVSKFNSSFRIIKKINTANKYIHPSFANGIVLIEKV